ncbi:type II toxin-antitoxin system Phd/YefM family antitoxin [Pelovirga terrestris]|uniref:Antitoxin n=1 Tax=Pelovirga terrestris TaxID=2771352 RepID=A0A8J6UHY4_9BACT|nr:type II toxin-antitoxin system Phd/YefM family antitoxin [Pelovirga terrestris]MBD1399975.1 type II toxin-antitoxin system Phd/YefM family antitoxin [Pelovirga terrestris]
MTRMGVSDAREHLGDVIDRARYTQERIVLTKRGREVGAIISIDDLKLLEMLEDQLDIKEARLALEESQGERVSYDEVRKKLGL